MYLSTIHESLSPEKHPPDAPKYRIVETQWGIWRVLTEHTIKSSWIFADLPLHNIRLQLLEIWECAPVARKFLDECYALAPHHFVLWIVMRLVLSMCGAASLYISSLLLDLVESFIENRDPSPRRLVFVATARLLFSLFQWLAHQLLEYSERGLQEKLGRRMSAYKVHVYARLDVPTADDASVRSRLDQLASTDVSWRTLNSMTGTVTKLLTIASQASVLLAVFRHEKGGPEFAALALIQPLVIMLGVRDDGPMPHNGVFAVFQANPYHKRMTDMKNIVTRSMYREEIVGSGLREYLMSEYRAADEALRNVTINDPWDSTPHPSSHWRSALPWLTLDLPWVLFAVYAFLSKGSVPLKALMLLEQSVTTLTYQVQDMFRDGKSIAGWLQTLRQVYDAVNIENKIVDGTVPYPRPGSDPEIGMKIEFKDVVFSYPDATCPAIRHMSFKVNPGDLCVVVGENGCGKSSTTKLLLRLFDPDEGQILIDDLPISEYRSEELRRAMSVLWQDYQTYPLSIGENIGIGAVEEPMSAEALRRAASLGNALEFIEALPHGFSTQVEGNYPYRDTLYNAKPDSLLRMRVNEIQNETRLSGGQWQRLALSRTFMRTRGVRLAMYDEPSAHLDPKAEFALFERLRAMKGERTMFFITHRFGHLTKYADLILFMKNGTIVEQGSHEELLAADGEYASLYNVQAKAFAPPSTDGTDTDPDPDGDAELSDDFARD